MSPFALQRARRPSSGEVHRMVQRQEGSEPGYEKVIRPAPYIENPPATHTGEEPEYVRFREILLGGDPVRAGEFYKQHPALQLAPLVNSYHCTVKHLVNLLPLLNLNRRHPKFDREIHSSIQCQVLHYLLNQTQTPEFWVASGRVSDPAHIPRSTRVSAMARSVIEEVMTQFVSDNKDLDVEKFLSMCRTFDPSPEGSLVNSIKKEAILHYMRPDHPLYDDLKFEDLDHPVTDEFVDYMCEFLKDNPQCKHVNIRNFVSKASGEQLERALSSIHIDNKYRKDAQTKAAEYVIKKKEPHDVLRFIAREKDKGLDLAFVWSATINAGRIGLANDLAQGGYMPSLESFARLFDAAPRQSEAILMDFLPRVDEEQLLAVLPYVGTGNAYRKQAQDRAVIYVIENKTADEALDFVVQEKEKGLDLTFVWDAAINAARSGLVHDLERKGCVPPRESLPNLLGTANDQEQEEIVELLEFLIEELDQGDPMEVDSSGDPSASQRESRV